ncbi:MAG: bifunctional UDP-N-acetylmuramoyl-tripeptide:D-alanyl-D-alanine ligase/alanine racemase [Flavobacteriales bacterium]
MSYSIEHIAQIVNAQIIGTLRTSVLHLSIDSRTIENSRNTLFFALTGSQKNGHEYIQDAYKKGIRCFVVSHVESTYLKLNEEVCFLIVQDPLKSLQILAQYHRESYDLQTIGITGSNGKTIVKEWLSTCLNDVFSIIRSPKSYNSQIGVPLSVWNINAKHTLGIFEAGISQVGEMTHLESIIQPKIGILTHIGSAHQESFLSKEELLEEKLNLFIHCDILIFPSLKKWVNKHIIKRFPNKKLLSWGFSEQSYLRIIRLKTRKNYTKIEAVHNHFNVKFKIPFVDQASIDNVLTTIVALLYFGFSEGKINQKISKLQPLKMRLELLKGIHENLLISDIYNADLDSVKISLDVLAHQEYSSKSLILTAFRSFNEEVFVIIKKLKLKHLVLIGDFEEDTTLAEHVFYYKSTEDFLQNTDFSIFKNEAILLKGSRFFGLERVLQKMIKKNHETIFEINLEHLVHNLNYFKAKLNPATKIMVMVKASSYGSGVYEIANLLKFHQVDYLGVAYPDEGITLRHLGIQMPIMVMNANTSSHFSIIENQLEPEIFSFGVLESFVEKLKQTGQKKYPIHLKLDTGMHRLGFEEKDIERLELLLTKYEEWIHVQSIFSHLATADIPEEKDFTIKQIQQFKILYKNLSSSLGYKPIQHILNSSGISHFSEYQFDMVRLGIGIYGYNFDSKVQQYLKHVGTLKSTLSQIKTLKEGDTVGYGRHFKAVEEMRIATIPIGYADGISRLQGNQIGYVWIHNQKASIIGNICMDMLMVDVSTIPCEEGDVVILLGEYPSLKEVAQWQKTIPYEVLTSISPRVKRIYYRE